MTLSVIQMMITQLPFRLNIIVSTYHCTSIILHVVNDSQCVTDYSISAPFSDSATVSYTYVTLCA